MLDSTHHAQYLEGLERLGKVLGYQTIRPNYQGATDCCWYGVFGNSREVVTFEAKIEHSGSARIEVRDVGQAHIQQARAEKEYQGFTVRSGIVTHLTDIAPSAQSSLGVIKLIGKGAISTLWERIKLLLSMYRDNWSPENILARQAATQPLRRQCPNTGWLMKVFDTTEIWITQDAPCADWAARQMTP